MGSYTSLTIDNYPVFTSKSYVDPDIINIFSESDKKIFHRSIGERNDEFIEIAYEYQTTVGNAIDRLEINGFTLDKSKNDFIKCKNDLIKELTSNLENDQLEFLRESYTQELKLLKSSNFNDFIKAFIEIRLKEIRHYMIDDTINISNIARYLTTDGWFLNYPHSDYWFYLRAFLESCEKDTLVIQDITELINAGYYDIEDEVRNITVNNQEKITILTEGESDIKIISKSIKLLYPHLYDFYNFKDFSISNAQGGAGQLFLEIKSLIAINHTNKVVALFDNDGEGIHQIKQLNKLKIPSNFIILTYPNLSLLEKYPTSNNIMENMNGIAGSIEMYLGRDILKEKGKFIHIELSSSKISQGKIKYKKNLIKKYNKKIIECQKNSILIDSYDWTEMRLLLSKLFKAFQTKYI
ncbi:MAG: hypothetical protein DRG78_01440 [Epsilonproteobacteria bacterium]|nr:MAG: hypothetical protein DRG78_01440 [Campylobacterota bacterium]